MCDDDKVGSLEVHIMCVMMIKLKVWRFTALHNVCDEYKFGSLEV